MVGGEDAPSRLLEEKLRDDVGKVVENMRSGGTCISRWDSTLLKIIVIREVSQDQGITCVYRFKSQKHENLRTVFVNFTKIQFQSMLSIYTW